MFGYIAQNSADRLWSYMSRGAGCDQIQNYLNVPGDEVIHFEFDSNTCGRPRFLIWTSTELKPLVL